MMIEHNIWTELIVEICINVHTLILIQPRGWNVLSFAQCWYLQESVKCGSHRPILALYLWLFIFRQYSQLPNIAMAVRRTLGSLFRLQLRVGSTQAFRMQRGVVRSSVSRTICPLLFQANQGFHTSSARQNEHIISIQDEDDFNKRVLNNSTPVIVDFFAT